MVFQPKFVSMHYISINRFEGTFGECAKEHLANASPCTCNPLRGTSIGQARIEDDTDGIVCIRDLKNFLYELSELPARLRQDPHPM